MLLLVNFPSYGPINTVPYPLLVPKYPKHAVEIWPSILQVHHVADRNLTIVIYFNSHRTLPAGEPLQCRQNIGVFLWQVHTGGTPLLWAADIHNVLYFLSLNSIVMVEIHDTWGGSFSGSGTSVDIRIWIDGCFEVLKYFISFYLIIILTFFFHLNITLIINILLIKIREQPYIVVI